jgi:transposase
MTSMSAAALVTAAELACVDAAGLGELSARLLGRIEQDRREIDWRDTRIEKLTFEMAQLKRAKFGRKSKQFNAEQKALFDEAVDADIAALEDQLMPQTG